MHETRHDDHLEPEADEVDLQEGSSNDPDPRLHPHDPATPQADALEQELTVGEGVESVVPDPDRAEPVDETEYEDPCFDNGRDA